MSIRYSIVGMVLILIFSCARSMKDEPMENARQFFKKLEKNGGSWVHFPNDTTVAFGAFIMKFELMEGDTLSGEILGSSKSEDTILFWTIREYHDAKKDSIFFEQKGGYGSASGFSFFPDTLKRESHFKMTYSNGSTEMHKDTHIFLNDSTLLTKSQIFDDKSQKWIKQPDATWTFNHTIRK